MNQQMDDLDYYFLSFEIFLSLNFYKVKTNQKRKDDRSQRLLDWYRRLSLLKVLPGKIAYLVTTQYRLRHHLTSSSTRTLLFAFNRQTAMNHESLQWSD